MDEKTLGALSKLNELIIEHQGKRESWIRHILLGASSLFGILVSLQNNALFGNAYYYLFALAISGLGIGVLMLSLCLYSFVDNSSRLKSNYKDEIHRASHEGRAIEVVAVSSRRIFVISEIVGYACFAIAIVLLSAFSILQSFV